MEQKNKQENILLKLIIRPPRNTYPDDSLEDGTLFQIGSKKYQKSVLSIKNSRGENLKCSYLQLFPADWTTKSMPVVIYMHGNASNKKEGEYSADLLLPYGINVFSFDFSGCGNSDGDMVTLGWKERDDLQAVIDYLKSTGTVSSIGLWGRSMGAATAVMYEKRENVQAMVLDSGFASLEDLIVTIGKEQVGLNSFFSTIVVAAIKVNMIKDYGLDIRKIKPVDYAGECHCPVLFIHGEQDTLTPKSHSQQMYVAYGGAEKELEICKGGHNDERPAHVNDKIVQFFKKHLQVDQ